MNIFKKIFSLAQDDDCVIGLCKFNNEDKPIQQEETPKRSSKEATLSQMLKRPI